MKHYICYKKFNNFLLSYDKFIELNPKKDWGWEKKCNLLEELQRYDEALYWLK